MKILYGAERPREDPYVRARRYVSGVVPILRENSSKSILFLRTFQGLSFDVASRNAVDVRFRSSERVTSAVHVYFWC